MALRCEICGRSSPEGSLRCDCGFELATGDVATSIAFARRDRVLALDKIARGALATCLGAFGVIACGMLAFFLVIAGTLFAAIPLIATFVLAAMGVSGLANVVGGARDHARAARLLRAAEKKRALPAARLIAG
jgi:hypothetical protein